MINIIPKEFCTSCQVCIDVCPVNCIKYEKNCKGFLYPVVQEERCIQCGQCLKVCPINSNDLIKSKKFYVGYSCSEKIRMGASSGGIFGTIATEILRNGGIIYGAAFGPNELSVQWKEVTKFEELEQLYTSKYIKCEFGGVYRRVLEQLKVGKIVLFCSTPCSCQGLLNFIPDKLKENLITIDFACHGVSSQYLFDENIKWWKKYRNRQIKKYNFRYKKHHLNCSKVAYILFDKRESCLTYLEDPFYFFYMKHISLYPSCYQCIFASDNRCTDLTVGDYHTPWNQFNENRLKGYSSILINTKKGEDILRRTSKEMILKEISYSEIINSNGALINPVRNKSKDYFYDLLDKIPYEELVLKFGYCSIKTIIKREYYHLPYIMQKIIRLILGVK